MIIRKEAGCELIKLVALLPIGRDVETSKALAQTTVQLLKKSTQSKSYLELNQAIDRFGATIEVYSSPLYITAEMYCIKKHFSDVIPLFFETIYEATFLQEDLEIVKSQNIDLISQNKLQTDVTADKLLSESLFGKDHILGYYSEVEDYHNIQLEDIKSFYSEHIATCKPQLFLAGDVESHFSAKIEQLITIYNLKNKPRNALIIEPFEKGLNPQIQSIPNSFQASLRMGLLLQHNSLEEYLTLDVLNFALGGHYTSELMTALRIKKGYTYGVYSYMLHFHHYTCLQIALEADKTYIEPSFNEIKRVMNRLVKNGFDMKFVLKQYYSQWLRNTEGALKEITFDIKFFKLGYDYNQYKEAVIAQNFSLDNIELTTKTLDFANYLKIAVQ